MLLDGLHVVSYFITNVSYDLPCLNDLNDAVFVALT